MHEDDGASDSSETQAQQAITPGRHDAFVVDATWIETDGAPALELDVTLTTGAFKGHVIAARFRHSTPAFTAATAAFGLENVGAGDTDAPVHMIGLPCTLVVAEDDAGRVGIAVEPA